MNAVAMNAHSTSSLAESKFILLTTYRKNGEPVATPVCHVLHDGKVYLVTQEQTWKAKRMRRNPRVLLAACDMRGKETYGPVYSGEARILSTEEIQESPVFKQMWSVGAGFRRSARVHWIVKPIQLMERVAYRHKFLAIEITPQPGQEW